MRITSDLHTHTLVSGHAYSTLQENVHAAALAGLEAIAITDHGPKLPTLLPPWYFDNMVQIPSVIEGVEVFHGIEANICDDSGTLDVGDDTLQRLQIVLASCHTICINGPDAAYYTQGCVQAMKNPRVNVIGHPDDGRMPVLYPEIVLAAAETNTLLELNNHSLSPAKPRLNAVENCKLLLAECRKRGVPVVISSDAHISYKVGGFQYALDMVRELDFPEELIANTSLEKLKAHLSLKSK